MDHHLLLFAGLGSLLAVHRFAPGLLKRSAKWLLARLGSVVSE